MWIWGLKMSIGLRSKGSIYEVTKDIEDKYFKLPNIQRYFVWDEEKMLKLLDSIFRGYPFGSILVWRPSKNLTIRAREFITDFKEGMKITSTVQDNNNFYLVLDGQQRLQTLYIALFGSYNGKKVYFKLNAKDDEPRFYLLPPEKVKDNMFIRPIRLLEELSDPTQKHKFLDELGVKDENRSIVEENIDVFIYRFYTQEMIHFLPPVEDKEIDDVVEIFIRVNSGGTVLTPSDLIFSTIVSKVSEFEDRFIELLDFMNDNDRFNFDISFLIKASLVILDKGAKYDIKKLKDEDYIAKLNRYFNDFEESIKATMDFVKNKMKIRNERFLKSKIALIPIIDWVFRQSDHQINETEICKLKQYLYLVSSNYFFSYGTDRKLDDIHKIIRNSKRGYFPWRELMDYLDDWGYENELSDELLTRKLDLVLNVVEDGIERIDKKRGWSIERDHIFPSSTLESLKIDEESINDVGNLRFLNKARNISKSNKIPERSLDFFGKSSVEETYYKCIDYLEKGDTENFKKEYLKFIKIRKELIISKLRDFLCM